MSVSGCYLLNATEGGGNRVYKNQTVIVRRNAALGDSIAATVVADALRQKGLPVILQTHRAFHSVLRRQPSLAQVTEPGGFCHCNLDGAYEKHPFRRTQHLYELFFYAAAQQLRASSIELGNPANCRPRLSLSDAERGAAQCKFEQYPKPWVFVCPRSDRYACRQVPDGVWSEAAKSIQGTKFWLGRFPSLAPANFVDLKCQNLESLMVWLSAADLLVTVDTGPMHIAAALGIPVLALGQSSSPELHLSDQVDFRTIWPKGLSCLNCQENLCPINADLPPCQKFDPEIIAAWANNQLRAVQNAEISCVIPIFRPAATMLNRCLQAVLPQVSEVLTTRERAGIVPPGVITHPKLRHIMKPADQIGFGRNVNFGFRHTRGKYVLVLNDDVYLAADAVARMLEVMKPGVGVVGHLTRYPDGTIYHAGKVRQPGNGIGFPHVDLRKTEPRIKQPLELENVNGASLLFRRSAFYDIGGYDERFKFYCEDDHICMMLRLHGWQVWYTPHATGIHDEHQETRKVPGINQIMGQSNRLFAELWRDYFVHNANNPGLGDFNYRGKSCVNAI